jgi:hypothetical protein
MAIWEVTEALEEIAEALEYGSGHQALELVRRKLEHARAQEALYEAWCDREAAAAEQEEALAW